MVSLRFPFLFSQPKSRLPPTVTSNATTSHLSSMACAVAASAAALAGITAATHYAKAREQPSLQNVLKLLLSNHSSLPWGSLSLADTSPAVVESRTGMSFPSVVYDCRRLLGIGLRKKRVLGLKNIDVYAFGVYADSDQVKKILGNKYGTLPSSELKDSKEFKEDIIESDICITVRLQMVYSKLSIRSVRSAFEESVGSRLQKFGGSDNKDLLHRFTSQFRDEYKIPRGSVIDLSREPGYVLRTTIDGEEVGSIQSKLLCRSILDLYIGEDPFDCQAKEEIQSKLASFL